MVRFSRGQSFLIFSCLLLFSCTKLAAGNLPQPKSTPQLPLTQAKTILQSPDGKWTAYFFDSIYFVRDYNLIVANFDDTIIWNVNQRTSGVESEFSPYRWSKDSKYLYFNIYVASDGAPFNQGIGLQKLDITNGQVYEILPSVPVEFSLSPNEDKLAYINKGANGIYLIILDMGTNTEKSIFFEQYSDGGSIVWSLNQDSLVFAAAIGNDWSKIAGHVELVRITSQNSKSLIQSEDWLFDPILWLNNHTILIRERSGDYFFFDIMSEELMPADNFTGLQN